MPRTEATPTTDETAAANAASVPEVPDGIVIELYVELDTSRTGPLERDRSQGLVPFGVDLMMRAIVTDEPFSPRLKEVTSFTKLTKTATSQATTPPPGGSPDRQGDTKDDSKIQFDERE